MEKERKSLPFEEVRDQAEQWLRKNYMDETVEKLQSEALKQ